jgi:hypothetical protein
VACAKNRDSRSPEEADKITICPNHPKPEVTTSEDVFDRKLTWPAEPAGGKAKSCWLELVFEATVAFGLKMIALEDCVTRERGVRTVRSCPLFMTCGSYMMGSGRRN